MLRSPTSPPAPGIGTAPTLTIYCLLTNGRFANDGFDRHRCTAVVRLEPFCDIRVGHSIRQEGRTPDLLCKREPFVRRGRNPTFNRSGTWTSRRAAAGQLRARVDRDVPRPVRACSEARHVTSGPEATFAAVGAKVRSQPFAGRCAMRGANLQPADRTT